MKNRTICGARRRLLRASLLTLAAASLSLAAPAFGQTAATLSVDMPGLTRLIEASIHSRACL